MIKQKFLTPSPRVGVKMETQLHDDKIFRKMWECWILRKGRLNRQVVWRKRNYIFSICTAFYTL